MKVLLSWAEVAVAARVGEARTIRNRARGSAHRHGKAAGADWTGDIEAAAAEMAAARALGYYWPIVAEPDRWGDLGYGLHVRHTPRADGRLILHRDDPDDHHFVLVTGSVPSFEVPGFLQARKGKDDQHWSDPGTGRPAFFIPQSALVPIEAITAMRPLPVPEGWQDAYTPPREDVSHG